MFLFESHIFKKVPFFETVFFFFLKKNHSLHHFLRKFNSLSHNFLERVQCFDYFSDKNFQFLSRIPKKKKKGSILWVKFKKRSFKSLSNFSRRFNSPSLFKQSFQFFASCSKKKRIQFFASYSKTKDSILCVVFKEKRVQFFASYSKKKGWNSLRRIWKKSWILWLILKKNQLFESWKNNSLSNFQWVILENTNSLTDTKQKFNSLSHIWRKVQFFES